METAQKKDRSISGISLQREKEWFRREYIKTCIEIFMTVILASDAITAYIVLL